MKPEHKNFMPGITRWLKMTNLIFRIDVKIFVTAKPVLELNVTLPVARSLARQQTHL